jgi:hypothetical protein
MMFTDTGARCDDHIGEAFPPRCEACDYLSIQEAASSVGRRLGFIPGTECPTHANYPLPCARCDRLHDDEEAQGGHSLPAPGTTRPATRTNKENN